MTSQLGKTLRDIRKGKQVSLSSLADQHLSKSQISRFERGESDISCSRLIHLLDKLHVSLDEFLILHEDSDSTSFSRLVAYIRKQYSLQNIDNIAKLLDDSSTYRLTSFEKTMVKSILHTVTSDIAPSEEDIQQLTDYLFQVEKWGYYEITLLGNCVRTFNYNAYYLLTKEMINNHIYSSLHQTNKKLVAQLAINCLLVSTDKNIFHHGRYLINEIEKLLTHELNFYEQTVFLYATGYFEFKQDIPSGIDKMQQAIQVFEILGEDHIKSQYVEHYQQYVKDSKH
ncbi:helix-turn-helix domain-containing protein [Streptococcus sp. zg-JUN1979]|uniref:helix-turn-helix domain-containing protein n=1 Tax=Streptococcus sp. zg-JUN1979 TaxID=3391450 RepID=UPI0039B09A83